MHETNRSRIGFISDIFRYSLVGILLTNILSPFVILFIDPEAFFLGQKIAGTPAVVYAIGLILVTALVMFCLYKKTKGYAVIALAYGILYFVNGYLIVLWYDNQVPPPVYWLVLLLSVILAGTTLPAWNGKNAGPDDESRQTIFEKNPRVGLLLSVGVLVCFLLFSSLSLLSYQKEYNTCLYQIEIEPDTPLHNVTLMVPLPPGISREIGSEDLSGSKLPYFSNYSQSVVETPNGTMIRITADSIEIPDNGLPQNPAVLNYRILVEGAPGPSFPGDNELYLSPVRSAETISCSNIHSGGMLTVDTHSDCSRYDSAIYTEFETGPDSETIITVLLDRTRMISSSRSPKRDAFQDRIQATIIGSADGWYNAPGRVLVSAKS